MSTEHEIDESKRLFKRLVLCQADLWQAADCARLILENNLHEYHEGPLRALHKGLNTALIVAYGRPFSGNHDHTDIQGRLPEGYFDFLSPQQVDLHKQIMCARNQEQAHTDGMVADLTVRVTKGFPPVPTGRNTLQPQTREIVKSLAELIEAWRSHLFHQMHLIGESYDDGEF